MSVYTTISESLLTDFLTHYSIGKWKEYQGISAGIENTNYFLTTEQGEYVLTIFEHHSQPDLRYFLNFMAYLADNGLPTAHPIANNQQQYLSILCNKPAAIVKRLSGKSAMQPNIEQIKALAYNLGQLHNISVSFQEHRANDRGSLWWKQTFAKIKNHISDIDKKLIEEEIQYQGLYHGKDLPHGTIHSDLFRDNALFVEDKLTGIIDFYYSCSGTLLYDVAVTVNDWCSEKNGALNIEKLKIFLENYHQQRKLQAIERGAWTTMLRAAALRFWLSRLHDWYFPRPGEMTHKKDPNEFKNILLHRKQNNFSLQQIWV